MIASQTASRTKKKLAKFSAICERKTIVNILQLEFEKLLEKKQIRNKKTYVKVPVNGTKSGFFISELLEMDTQERVSKILSP